MQTQFPTKIMADNPQLDSMVPPCDAIDFATKDTLPLDEKLTDGQSNEAPTSPSSSKPPSLPSLRAVPDSEGLSTMTASSTPLGMLANARRPRPGPSIPGSRSSQAGRQAGGALPPSMAEKMKAFHSSRQGTPSPRPQMSTTVSAPGIPGSPVVDGLPGKLQLPPNMRPSPQSFVSAPAVPKMKMGGGLSARRGMKLPGGLPPAPAAAPGSESNGAPDTSNGGSMFNQFAKYVDTKNGTLKFAGKAVIHGNGIDFANGTNFNISLDEVDTLEELGKGNYGTVYKVRHARPRMRKPGLGLAGNKSPSAMDIDDSEVKPTGDTTGVVMAMKELRLELDEAKFAAIIMELDILHRCLSPYIIDFYGAFFQEGAVYICIEFMDGGSIDKLYGDGIPENVLRKITYATTQGLKTLKDEHNIIHRDVKPTNILVNTKGQVKICDFGVSGNLVASIAKTNIGCQSYMAPERISGGGISQAGANPGGGTYSVQSDIWSLGLSVIECAMGRYPYPPETYNNIFSQLSAIVDGDPPDLPEEGFTPVARNFVRGCLNKIPKLRPTYSDLLQHPWLADLSKPSTISEEDEDEEDVDMESLNLEDGVEQDKSNGILTGTEDSEVAEWVKNAIERKKQGLMGTHAQPALHKAPLDTVSPLPSPS
ncbi:0c9e8d3c-da23-404a-9289-c2052f454b4c [Sclerotinia trifoliorum]|uniref:mitogen-activated protein kinase kinase n=1 Tax=Sclerotinia trifoliorum TaxID=28548 RepID=A0A8H2VX47_9HELO|nr:0c9e8d3c-da23-404a-9289-c2052f454b4c [Sclerotinia trifoliorum]